MDTHMDPFAVLMKMSHGGPAGGQVASTSAGISSSSTEYHHHYMNEIELKSSMSSDSMDDDDDLNLDDDESALSESEFEESTVKRQKTAKGIRKAKAAAKQASRKGKKAGKASQKQSKGKAVSHAKQREVMTLEEQQEIEEPVEIDMRNVYKAYGINPVQPKLQKTSNRRSDIISYSIGEAYWKQSHGKHDEALSLLFETVRNNPSCSQPYEALGEYFLSIGSHQKALEFFVIAIQFNHSDSNRWVQLAETANLCGMHKSAIEFYSRAIKLNSKNQTYYIKKGNLEEQIHQYEKAMKTYEKLLSLLEESSDIDVKIILSTKFRIASILSDHLNRPKDALTIVEEMLQTYNIENDPVKKESFFRLYINPYFDLLFKNGHHLMVLGKLIQYNLILCSEDCKADVTSEEIEYDVELIASDLNNVIFLFDREMDVSAALVVKSKFVCVFIYQELLHFADHFIAEFEEIEGNAHLIEAIYPTIVSAFLSTDQFERACLFARKLVAVNETCSRYWHWYGLCLSKSRHIDQMEAAIEAFETSIRYDRDNFDAVNELSLICNLIGNPERALDNVSLMERNRADSFDFKLLYNRCNLLYICKRWHEFIDSAEILLNSEMFFFDNWMDIKEITHPNMCVASLMRVSKRLYRRYAKRLTLIQLTGGRLSLTQFLDLWKKSVFVLLNHIKEDDTAIRWAFSSLLTNRFESLHLPCTLVMFRCCLDAKNQTYTYDLARFLLKEHPKSGKLWYAFSVTMNDIYQDFRHKRFCMRMWKAHPESGHENIQMMNGHIALLNGRYRDALAIFLIVFRESNYRYASFYIALCYMHMLMQNHTVDKCSLFAQMLAFFDDYVQRVGKCQETYYNLGRVYHQLGFNRHAVELYTVALKTPLKIHDKRFDLTPEIAFNLSQIYRRSGDHSRANQLIAQYCTI